MSKTILLNGTEAATILGIKPSWFRELVIARNIQPAKIGPRKSKLYRKSVIAQLKRETRHPGRPKIAPASTPRRK